MTIKNKITPNIAGVDISKIDGVKLYRIHGKDVGAYAMRLREDTILNKGERPTIAGSFVVQYLSSFKGDKPNTHYVYSSGEFSDMFELAGESSEIALRMSLRAA